MTNDVNDNWRQPRKAGPTLAFAEECAAAADRRGKFLTARIPARGVGTMFPAHRLRTRKATRWHRLLGVATLLLTAASWAEDPGELEQNGYGAWGAYLDLSYPVNFNSGQPHPWRSKVTTNRLSQFTPNMGMVYFRSEASETSRWGFELGAQGGYDTDGQVPAMSPLPGADVLRYVSRANLSYLAPIGKGLLLTGGLMNSFIGYESFYAKDNPNYTRSWIADYSPFFLIGIGGRYRASERLDTAFFVVSDYDYLAHQNNQPKYAGQISWRINREMTVTENLFVGPEQSETAMRYWRFFSDTLLKWTDDVHTIGLAYDVGTQQAANTPSTVQSFWTGAALFTRWQVHGPWAVALRPELYWDANGTLTGAIQFIKAVTATVEYSIVAGSWKTQLRAEYRYDNSTGRQGGFYGSQGIDGPLVSGQSTVFFVLLASYDSF